MVLLSWLNIVFVVTTGVVPADMKNPAASCKKRIRHVMSSLFI